MTASILVVEDEREIAELITIYLEREGARIVHASTGEEALELFDDAVFDLVLLDINLPGADGFEVLEQIRRSSDVPVIIISAREADEDQIFGLGIGADEYVTKPFSPRVLVAKTRAILRRGKARTSPGMRFGPFTYQPDSYLLTKNGERVILSAKEFDVLKVLIDADGAPLRSEDIYARVWGNQFGDVTTVGVYIQRVRKKLEDDPQNPVYIETIYGRGYRFCSERLSRDRST
jgi:DNA-binding response OmpR family regulator